MGEVSKKSEPSKQQDRSDPLDKSIHRTYVAHQLMRWYATNLSSQDFLNWNTTPDAIF